MNLMLVVIIKGDLDVVADISESEHLPLTALTDHFTTLNRSNTQITVVWSTISQKKTQFLWKFPYNTFLLHFDLLLWHDLYFYKI